jgi:hypothetical protein
VTGRTDRWTRWDDDLLRSAAGADRRSGPLPAHAHAGGVVRAARLGGGTDAVLGRWDSLRARSQGFGGDTLIDPGLWWPSTQRVRAGLQPGRCGCGLRRIDRGGRRRRLRIAGTWPWAPRSPLRSPGCRPLRPADRQQPPLRQQGQPPGRVEPAHPARQPGRQARPDPEKDGQPQRRATKTRSRKMQANARAIDLAIGQSCETDLPCPWLVAAGPAWRHSDRHDLCKTRPGKPAIT